MEVNNHTECSIKIVRFFVYKIFKSQSDFIANRLLDTVGEGEGGANRIKRVTLKHMLRFGKKIMGIC